MREDLIVQGFQTILEGLGINGKPDDLRDTPARAAKFLSECLSNQGVDNADIAKRYAKVFPVTHNDPVIVTGIPIFSFCEHHIALMYDMTVDVAYMPDGWVLGLSKISRIADAASRKLQIQERLTSDIADIISIAAKPRAVLVRIRGKHACVTARGIRKDAETLTEAARGDELYINTLRGLLWAR